MKSTIITALTLAGWLLWPHGRTVTIHATSTLPFPAVATFCLPSADGCTAIERRLEPGQRTTIEWYFSSAADHPSYEVALTASGPVVSAIYAGPMPFEGDIERKVGDAMLSFQRIALTEDFVSDVAFAAPHPDNEALLLMPLASSLEEARDHARQLESVLALRLAFVEELAGLTMPIDPHANFTDDNSYGLGVTVVAADLVSALGGRVNLEPGDVVLRINQTPIFSPADAYRELWSHVQTRSAGAPIVFRALRDGRTVSAISSVSFSNAFFAPDANDAPEAFVRAAGTALTLGTELDTFLLCENDENSRKCAVREKNRRLLLRQQHPTADLLGSLAAAPVPLLRGPFARILPRGRAGRYAATVLGDAAETAIFAANEAPPGVDRKGEAATGAAWGAGVSLVTTRIR